MGDGTGRRLRWLLGDAGGIAADTPMQIVMLATAVSMAGVLLVSPIVSALADPFAVSPARIGGIMAAFTAPSILLVPFVGVLADRVGRKPVLVAGIALVGIGGVAIAGTTSFAAVLALRAVQGTGYAAINTIGVALLGDLYAGQRESTAQGLRLASMHTTTLLAPPIAGALVLVSWRYPFVLYAGAIALAAWAWLSLPTVDAGTPMTVRRYARDLAGTLARPVLAVVLATFAARFVLTFGFFGYVSLVVAEAYGASAGVSGLAVSGFGLAAILGSTQVGRATDRWGIPGTLSRGFLVLGAGLLVVGAGRTLPALAAGVGLFGVGAALTGATQKSLVTQLAPDRLRAGAVAASIMVQAIGMSAGPLLVGGALVVGPVAVIFVAFGLVGGLVGAGLAVVITRFLGSGSRVPA